MARLEQTDKGIELHIDGSFIASWSMVLLEESEEGIVLSMIEEAVKYGERKKAKEIKNALNL